MRPPTIQAAKTSLAEPTARAMSLVTRKIPVPMVSPMTIAVADHRPRPRIKSDGSGRAARSGRVAHMKVQRAYYQGLRRSTRAACWLCAGGRKTGACVLCGCEAHLRAIIEAAMAAQKSMLNEFAWDQRYKVSGIEDLLTPALLMYPESIASNVERTVELLGGDADRWRVHIKTAKLGYTVRMLVGRGIRNFKCATTLELLVACQGGAADVLLAYPSIGANARRVREIAEQFPEVRISTLAENEEQVRQWRGSRVGVFLDINPGMDRTGIEQTHSDIAVQLARAIAGLGLEFRGLHYYDGHLGGLEMHERIAVAHAGYERLLKVVNAIERSGTSVAEVITAGTPTLPCSLAFEGFRGGGFLHR